MRRLILSAACLVAAAAAPPPAVAGDRPWARATAPHQEEGAVYLTLTAAAGDQLLDAASPDAGMAMLHQSSSRNGVSEMSELTGLDLPAGKPVALAPRGTHIMLMHLAHPLAAGSILHLTLSFAHARPLTLEVPVLPIGSSGPPLVRPPEP